MSETPAPPALIRGTLHVPQAFAAGQLPRGLEDRLEAMRLLTARATERRWHIDAETGAWVLEYTVTLS